MGAKRQHIQSNTMIGPWHQASHVGHQVCQSHGDYCRPFPNLKHALM